MERAALCLQETGPSWAGAVAPSGSPMGIKEKAEELLCGRKGQSYVKVIEGEGKGPEAVLQGQVI